MHRVIHQTVLQSTTATSYRVEGRRGSHPGQAVALATLIEYVVTTYR